MRLFEGLMPANSSHDSGVVRASIRKFKAFPRVQNPSIRQELQNRLLNCERILTLRSFHRDTIVLEGSYQPLRDLFPVEGTTLRSVCEASFKHDHRYFVVNYIDLWLDVMRNHPYLSNHPSAKPIQGRDEDRPTRRYLKNEADVSRLASFAASRGFLIENPSRQHDVEMESQRAEMKLPKLSCNKNNIPRHHRSSRPRACDFEQAWKHLFLQNVFSTHHQPVRKYPTAFAVIRDIVQCFWGSVTLNEINNPDRILHVHQHTEQQNSANAIPNDLQVLPSQDGCAADSNPTQGLFKNPVDLPRPVSSEYSVSSRSSRHSPTSRSMIGGEVRSEKGIDKLHRCPMDITDAEDEAVKIASYIEPSHANASNEDVVMQVSPVARSHPPAAPDAESFVISPQDVVREQRGKPEKGPNRSVQGDGILRKTQTAGRQGVLPRVEKSQHHTRRKNLRKQQKKWASVLHGHDDNGAPLQMSYSNLPDTEGAEETLDFSTAMPHMVHDDSGITAQSSDADAEIENIGNKWHNNDGDDDDVQTATRKAEEQMRSAEDAVGEIYDDNSADHNTNRAIVGTDTGSDKVVHNSRDTQSGLFPRGIIEPSSISRQYRNEGLQSEKTVPLRTKRNAVYLEAGHDDLPNIQAIESNGDEINRDRDNRKVSHMSMFPGGPLKPAPTVREVVGDDNVNANKLVPSQSDQAQLGKRRWHSYEFDDREYSGDWESMKILIASVESIWDQLDHTRIHITSTIDIVELDSKRVKIHERLWSWSRDEKDQFKLQIGQLVKAKELQLQMVSRNRESISPSYSAVSEMGYWISYYEFPDRSTYWLAILIPKPNVSRRRKKARRDAES